ncbi:MAG: hypothetical protein KJ077_20020 [Anaerolineae bacterium]|nr:hypothetical protein [Anaerolineae bacterium]
MSQFGTIPLARLRADVHHALRFWHGANDGTSPLNYLTLFRQALRSDSFNARLATNLVLDQALRKLEQYYDPLEAILLKRHFTDGATMFQVANELNLAESWANKRQKQAIDHVADIIYKLEHQARGDHLIALEKRLDLPPSTQLIGVDHALIELLDLLNTPQSPWLIAMEGLGGIGKTALANALVREIAPTGRFYEVAWVSAKQQDFLPGVGLLPSKRPALDLDTLSDVLLEQLGDEAARTCPPAQKMIVLTQLLKHQPYLVVIDNLETVVDYQTLLPALRKLANPTKFLLTSRYMQARSEVSRFPLTELSQADTFTFLKHEAKMRRLMPLIDASSSQLDNIYQIVGGNPLALKLVVGQISALPLAQVLENLKRAKSQKVEELYTFIFWQAWQTLEPASRQALLAMPLVQNGTIEQLALTSQLELDELRPAIEQLMTLSLIEVSGDLEQRRYRIHHLTETFLLTEIAQWPSPP